jgi:dTDP-4-amino-4,6-dideoxygalactose transaminase
LPIVEESSSIDEASIEALVLREQAIVHCTGVKRDMDVIMDAVNTIYLLWDAAQAIDGLFTDRNGVKALILGRL